MLRTDFTSLKELQELNIAVVHLTSLNDSSISKIHTSLNGLKILSHEALSLSRYISPTDESQNPFPMKEGYFHTMVSRHFNFALWDRETLHINYQTIKFPDLLSYLNQRFKADEAISVARQSFSAYDLHKTVLPEGSLASSKEHQSEPFNEDVSVFNLNPSRRWHGVLFVAKLLPDAVNLDEMPADYLKNRKIAIISRYSECIKALTKICPLSNGDSSPICPLPTRLFIMNPTNKNYSESLELVNSEGAEAFAPKEIPVVYCPPAAALAYDIGTAVISLMTAVAVKFLMRICCLTYGREDYMTVSEIDIPKNYPHLLHSRCGAARQQKIIGDICLLLGCYKDAQIAYQSSLNMFVNTASDIRARSKHKFLMTELPVPPELAGVVTMAYPSENDFLILEADTIWFASALEGSATALALAEFITSFAKLPDHVTGSITDRLYRAAWIFSAKKFYFCSSACLIKSTSVSKTIHQSRLAMIASNAVQLSEYMTHVHIALAARIFQNLSIITSMPRNRALYSLFAAQNWLLLNENDLAFKSIQRSFRNFKCNFLLSGLLMDALPSVSECLLNTSDPDISSYSELVWPAEVVYEPPKLLPKIYPYQIPVIRLARLAKQTSFDCDFYDVIEALTLNSATNPRGSGSKLITVQGLVETISIESESDVVVSAFHDKNLPQADYIYKKNKEAFNTWCQNETYMINIESSMVLNYCSLEMLAVENKPLFVDDVEVKLIRVPIIYHGDFDASLKLPENIPIGSYKIIAINGHVGTCPVRCLFKTPVDVVICGACPKLHLQCHYKMALFDRTHEGFDGVLHLKNCGDTALDLEVKFIRSVEGLKVPPRLDAFAEVKLPIKITEDSEIRVKSSLAGISYPFRLNILKIIDEKLLQLNLISTRLNKLIESYTDPCRCDSEECTRMSESLDLSIEKLIE